MRRLPRFSQEEQAALEAQLARHKRSLAILERKAATYSPLERPVSLINEVEEEKEAVARLEKELRKWGDE